MKLEVKTIHWNPGEPLEIPNLEYWYRDGDDEIAYGDFGDAANYAVQCAWPWEDGEQVEVVGYEPNRPWLRKNRPWLRMAIRVSFACQSYADWEEAGFPEPWDGKVEQYK